LGVTAALLMPRDHNPQHSPTTAKLCKPQPPADTPENNARYERLIEVADREVQRGRAAFYEAAKAMKELRDSRLYLLTYKNWSDCCRSRWDYSANYVNRMIADAKTADEVAGIVARAASEAPAAIDTAGQDTKMVPIGTVDPTELVANEHQARLLKPYLPELSRRVVVEREEPRAVVDELLDEARAKQEQRKNEPVMALASPPSGQEIEQWLKDGLELLDDESTKAAFDQYADLVEHVWRCLMPTWFARRSVSPTLERGTRRKP
jgi:hypothetical protein